MCSRRRRSSLYLLSIRDSLTRCITKQKRRASEQRSEEKVKLSSRMADAVHHHALEESGQQRSEEKIFTLLMSRGRSTRCITTRRRRADCSAATRRLSFFC